MEQQRDELLVKIIGKLRKIPVSDLQLAIDMDIFTKDQLLQTLRSQLESSNNNELLMGNCLSEIAVLFFDDLTTNDKKKILKHKNYFCDDIFKLIIREGDCNEDVPLNIILRNGTSDQIKNAIFSLSVKDFISNTGKISDYLINNTMEDTMAVFFPNRYDETLSDGTESSEDLGLPENIEEVSECIREYLDQNCREIFEMDIDDIRSLEIILVQNIPSESFVEQYIDHVTNFDCFNQISGYMFGNSVSGYIKSLINVYAEKGKIDDVFSLKMFMNVYFYDPNEKVRDIFITEKIAQIFPEERYVPRVFPELARINNRTILQYEPEINDLLKELLDNYD